MITACQFTTELPFPAGADTQGKQGVEGQDAGPLQTSKHRCAYPACTCAFIWTTSRYPPCPITGKPITTPQRAHTELRDRPHMR